MKKFLMLSLLICGINILSGCVSQDSTESSASDKNTFSEAEKASQDNELMLYDVPLASALYRCHDNEKVPLDLVESYLNELANEDFTHTLTINSIKYAEDGEIDWYVRLYSDNVGYETAVSDFTVVKAEYSVDYDNTLTPLEDGDITELFYLQKNNENWVIDDHGLSHGFGNGITPSSAVYTYLKENGADYVQKIVAPFITTDSTEDINSTNEAIYGSFDNINIEKSTFQGVKAEYLSTGEMVTKLFALKKTDMGYDIIAVE